MRQQFALQHTIVRRFTALRQELEFLHITALGSSKQDVAVQDVQTVGCCCYQRMDICVLTSNLAQRYTVRLHVPEVLQTILTGDLHV